MVATSEMQSLPSGPASLSFNKDEFMRVDFKVDEFVVECRRRVPLETLRDDLSVYLKILQTAMIELINKDYADFVNLSTNLVGLDKAISSLTTPLGQLKEEVQKVREALDEALSAVEGQLQKQAQIREKKCCMKRLLSILESVEKIEKLLGIQPHEEGQGPCKRELTGQLIERMATEFNKLQFHVNKSRGLPLVEEIRPRIATITSSLQYNLEGSFVEGLEARQVEVLRQCLRTYATIDKTKDAENLFRQHIVKEYMEEVISEHFISTHPNGLQGMYNKILEFIPKECRQLREALAASSKDGGEVVRGYDFLVNAVWPEIVANIEARTPSIFAPGNPNVFHERYSVSMEFLSQFERQCGSQASVKRLRAHPSYNSFMSRWSLPVYFQIRFQEIAGSFESALTMPYDDAKDGSEFRLHVTETLWECLGSCWTRTTVLPPLAHRFWKLTLQLLARYVSWMVEVKETELNEDHTMTRRSSMDPDSSRHESEAKRRISLDPELLSKQAPGSSAGGLEASIPEESESAPPITTSQIVTLVIDAQNLASKIPAFYDSTVQPYLEQLGLQEHADMKASLVESQSAIEANLPAFGEFVTLEITSLCSVHLKLVGDIPRLYRRTNREVPTKASSYVSSTLKPLTEFTEQHRAILPAEMREDWVLQVVSHLAEQYYSITSDVLTSVKKMEESLKRLKKARKSAAAAGMSDDDKIRLQLYLDVKYFGEQIAMMSATAAEAKNFTKLLELVSTAKEAGAS